MSSNVSAQWSTSVMATWIRSPLSFDWSKSFPSVTCTPHIRLLENFGSCTVGLVSTSVSQNIHYLSGSCSKPLLLNLQKLQLRTTHRSSWCVWYSSPLFSESFYVYSHGWTLISRVKMLVLFFASLWLVMKRAGAVVYNDCKSLIYPSTIDAP